MNASTLSEGITKTNSAKTNVDDITKRVSSSLRLGDEPADDSEDTFAKPDDESDQEDWEKLADRELQAPTEAFKPPASKPYDPNVLELNGFDPRMQMHQVVKEFTKIVDPTGSMPFRPKMVNQSLILTFNNAKHASLVMYSYSCVTPQDPLGTLRRSDGNPRSRISPPANALPPAPPSPARVQPSTHSSRPLTTDSVARRFITGHLGIKTTTSPERREYEKLVRIQARQQKEERERQRQKEMEDQRRQEEELKNVWERG